MVTAATPDIEPAWLEQLGPKGLLLAPLALAPGLAYIVRGTVTEEIFHGRLTRAAYFMPLRTEDEVGPSDLQATAPAGEMHALEAPWVGWFDRRRDARHLAGFQPVLGFFRLRRRGWTSTIGRPKRATLLRGERRRLHLLVWAATVAGQRQSRAKSWRFALARILECGWAVADGIPTTRFSPRRSSNGASAGIHPPQYALSALVGASRITRQAWMALIRVMSSSIGLDNATPRRGSVKFPVRWLARTLATGGLTWGLPSWLPSRRGQLCRQPLFFATSSLQPCAALVSASIMTHE